MSISFAFTEDKIQPPTEHEIRIQADKPNSFSKKFANTTWEVVYNEVKEGYDKGEFKAYYEQRDPNKPCNFHVDIDDEVDEATFNDELYLKQIRDDFDAVGITETWTVQRAHGVKPSGFKVSYHITIPGVRFESHKHLKQWLVERCTKTDNVGQDKNGRRKNKPTYTLGTTKIDMAVYSKGAWRFPMCAKEGSKRVLKYTEPMTLQVFKELSIHHIADDARTIQVELPITIIKKKRSLAVTTGTGLTDEEKERYKLEGDFVWGQQREDGWVYIKATSDVWRCPFDVHKDNRQVSVCGTKVYCHGCGQTSSVAKKQRLDLLPQVPDIEPEDLYVGSDECYAKTMLAWYGHNFLYSSKRKKHYFWNGDVWEEAEDQAYYHIEDLYKELKTRVDDELEGIETPTDVPVVDTSTLKDADEEVARCKEAKRKANEALSSLKINHANAIAEIEQQIVAGRDKKKEKVLIAANAKVEKEETKAECDKAASALSIAIANKKRAQTEYSLNLAKAMDGLKKQKAEPEERKKELNDKKFKLVFLQNKVNKDRIVTEFLRQCKRYLTVDVHMDVNDAQKEMFHFQNGVVNLRDGTFRRRLQTDFVTCCLPYDYGDRDEGLIRTIMSALKQIKPTDEAIAWTLSWLGYCLTGHTKELKFFAIVGYTSDNAKSFLLYLMIKCFPVYVKMILNDAFDKVNNQYAKSLYCLLEHPFRIVWMNEWGNKTIDEDRLCNFVDGKDFPIKVIYEKSEIMLQPHAKIVSSGNNDPRIAGATKGTYRRGVSDIFESEFVEDDDQVDHSKHRYKKDNSLLDRFNDDAYKLSFFHILLPYAIQYCKDGLKVPKKYSDHFKECIDDGDEFTEVLDKFVITQDDSDCISKREVMDIVNKARIPPYMKGWKFVLSKFKSKRVIYDSQKRGTITVEEEEYFGGPRIRMNERVKGYFTRLVLADA